MKYFDAHNHLQNYASEDELTAALRAAADGGVDRQLCCGTCPEDWGRVLELAGRCPGVTPCFGLHPWLPADDGWLQKLEEFLRRVPSCVGEIGLDGVRGLPGQEERFEAQLALASYFDKPAVVHCVKNWGRLQELLRGARLRSFLLHGYGGSAELVKEFAALGGYFSFGREIADPAREKLRAALAAVPADKLLFETESPESGGASGAGPAGVVQVIASAAAVLGRPAEELAQASYANGIKFLEGLK